MNKNIDIIAIGTSAGGVAAVQQLLSALVDFKIPIVIIQHLPVDSNIDPELVFCNHTKLQVNEAKDKMDVKLENIYFAPPAYHLLAEKDQSFSLTQDQPVNHSRPSIDVFFESMALAYGEKCCGIVLTGANADGANGLKDIKESGGLTIVQNPETAEIPYMPQSALNKVDPDYMGNIAGISDYLNKLNEGKFA